jgi:hypothetical protein
MDENCVKKYVEHNVTLCRVSSVNGAMTFSSFLRKESPHLYDQYEDIPDYSHAEFKSWYTTRVSHQRNANDFMTHASGFMDNLRKVKAKVSKAVSGPESKFPQRRKAIEIIKRLLDASTRDSVTVEEAQLVNRYTREVCNEGRDVLSKAPAVKDTDLNAMRGKPTTSTHGAMLLEKSMEALEKFEDSGRDLSAFTLEDIKYLKIMTEYLCKFKDQFQITKAAAKVEESVNHASSADAMAVMASCHAGAQVTELPTPVVQSEALNNNPVVANVVPPPSLVRSLKDDRVHAKLQDRVDALQQLDKATLKEMLTFYLNLAKTLHGSDNLVNALDNDVKNSVELINSIL